MTFVIWTGNGRTDNDETDAGGADYGSSSPGLRRTQYEILLKQTENRGSPDHGLRPYLKQMHVHSLCKHRMPMSLLFLCLFLRR